MVHNAAAPAPAATATLETTDVRAEVDATDDMARRPAIAIGVSRCILVLMKKI